MSKFRKRLPAGWLTVVLVAGYILFQLLADISAAKIVAFMGLFLPGGTFVYAITFTWRDMIHKWLGKRTAVLTIWTAAACNIVMALYFMWVTKLDPAPFWQGQESFQTTLAIVPRIVIASIAAELVAELIDTEVFHFADNRKWPQWIRVLVSNAISLPLDSIIFVYLAFGGTMPAVGLWEVIRAQIVLKGLITVVSLPLIYLIPDRAGGSPGCQEPTHDWSDPGVLHLSEEQARVLRAQYPEPRSPAGHHKRT